MKSLTVIGSTELVDLPRYDVYEIPAKIDTGADISSIWATDIVEDGKKLSFKLFGPASKLYTGKTITVKSHTTKTIVNSFGHKEDRYSVKLSIVVGGRPIRATMTLANRENTTYPVLLGRRLLTNKFLVDVAHRPIHLDQTKSKETKSL